MFKIKFRSFIALIFALAITACGEGGKTTILPIGGGGTGSYTVVNIAAIPGIVPPVRGESPVLIPIETAQYTGSVSWSPNDDPFKPGKVYTAYITLIAKSGFTVTGVAANFFTVAGASSVAKSADSSIVSAVFPATGAAEDTEVLFLSVEQTGGASETANSTGLALTFDVDPATLTADNITVTGAAKGALSGTGKTRTIAISSITVANGAPVTVTITSPSGYSISGSAKTVVVYRLLAVGQPFQGGLIAYIYQSGDPGYVPGETHGIIAATADQGTGIIWAKAAYQATAVPGGTSTALGTGSSNTDNIIFQNGSGTTYAAGFARTYRGGGYTDWYLPSKDELNKLYGNRTAIGGFALDRYWSASELNPDYAWTQDFYNGNQNQVFKNLTYMVRAVRAF